MEDRICFVKGCIEDVDLPVDKVCGVCKCT